MAIINGNNYSNRLYGTSSNDTINGYRGNDTIYGYSGNDYIDGGSGIDIMYGSYGNDNFVVDNIGDIVVEYSGQGIDKVRSYISYTLGNNLEDLTLLGSSSINGAGNSLSNILYGNNSNNTFYGLAGNDTIYGNGGNDTLDGGTGNDIYIFNTSWGQDYVQDNSGTDIIRFDSGITQSNLSFSRDGNNVLIKQNGTSNSISVNNWYTQIQNKIERIEFSDGSFLTIADIENRISNTIYGTTVNDTIYGTSANDTINGLAGNDVIYGNGGNDTYIFNKGDGSDTIKIDDICTTTVEFGFGISQNDLDFTAIGDGSWFRIKNKLTSDTIDVEFWIWSEDTDFNIRFADGTTMSYTQVINRIQGQNLVGDNSDNLLYGTWKNDYINGNAGNDTIIANGDDDTIIGNTGNDTLYGDMGNDTYIFNLGDGRDIILDAQGNDTIKFGNGITLSQLLFTAIKQDYSLTDLIINIKDNSEQITISDWENREYQIERLVFTDGTFITNNDINNFMGKTILGTNGNDSLDGTIFNDIIIGQIGNDTLYGDLGDDTYIFNKGDGQDNIVEYNFYGSQDVNTIKFGAGISKNDLIIDEYFEMDYGSVDIYYASANIRFKDSTDSISLGRSAYKFALEFADGTKTDIKGVMPININGTENNDNIIGNSNSNLIRTYGGNDTISDIFGGNDTVYAGSGNDSIKLGKGANYQIYGEDGDDYIYVEGYTAREIMSGNNLFNYSNAYIDGGTGNDTIIKYGGQNAIYGGIGDDKITSYTEGGWDESIGNNDYINGEDGNDYIEDYGGSDTLVGGKGNDTIISYDYNDEYYGNPKYNWNDTYIFNNGDGQDVITDYNGTDVIKFGSGINKSNLTFARSSNNVVIGFNNSTDKITIQDWYSINQYNPQGNYKIESLQFADSTSMTSADIERIISDSNFMPTPTVIGTDGYDYPRGYNGNDVYYLKKGNDRVMDYLGNDSYLFYKGDGADNITDQAGSDAIMFGSGISRSGVTFLRDPNNSENMIIRVNNTSDSVNVNKWFRSSAYQIEKVQFSDGTFLTNSNINQLIQQMASYSVANNSSIDSSSIYNDSSRSLNLVMAH